MAKRKPREGADTAVVTEKKTRTSRPRLWRVLLHNDDFTTMEFVVEVLKKVFGKSDGDAFQIMWAVHTQGVGVAGIYTYEVAEMKIEKTTQMARAQEFPLLCTLEEEPGES